MISDALAKNALGPFVLRLALAVIFIYHGLDKVVGKDNTWGASWATNAWRQQAEIPADVGDKLDSLKKDKEKIEDKDRIEAARNSLVAAYARQRVEPPPTLRFHAAQIAVAWGELLGGIALLLGLLTRWAAAGLVIIQAGAIATVTAGHGFSVTAGGGVEYNVALIAMCLTLILVGGGAWALDRMIRFRRRTRTEHPIPVSL